MFSDKEAHTQKKHILGFSSGNLQILNKVLYAVMKVVIVYNARPLCFKLKLMIFNINAQILYQFQV